MNTDESSTAREEAAEDAADLWTHRQGYAMTGTEWGAFEQGHLAGSAWARDHLAVIVEAEVRAAKAEALKGAVEEYAITIPDVLGYKVPAVTVEDLLDVATEYETGDQA